MYFFIRNSEDGVEIEAYENDDVDDALKELAENDAESKPSYRTVFMDELPDDWACVQENCLMIIKGEIVIPTAAKVVESYELLE